VRRRPWLDPRKRDGLAGPPVGGRQRLAGIGQRQRWDAEGRLGRDTQRLPARGEQAQIGTRVQERIHQDRARVPQMLAVVEHQQQALVGQIIAQRCNWPARRLLAKIQRLQNGVHNQRAVAERCELD
jgi:hypothetical protein